MLSVCPKFFVRLRNGDHRATVLAAIDDAPLAHRGLHCHLANGAVSKRMRLRWVVHGRSRRSWRPASTLSSNEDTGSLGRAPARAAGQPRDTAVVPRRQERSCAGASLPAPNMSPLGSTAVRSALATRGPLTDAVRVLARVSPRRAYGRLYRRRDTSKHRGSSL